MHLRMTTTFDKLYRDLAGLLCTAGRVVDTDHWQALENVPQTKTIELTFVTVNYPLPSTASELRDQVIPSWPWAEDQFQERVAGEPVNPGRTYVDWPYYRGNVPKHQDPADGDKFSHTYMERFWPRWAGTRYGADVSGTGCDTVYEAGDPEGPQHKGIRYRYGDLDDVVDLLAKYPHTRQAYLPIFFPEDTGAHHGQRIPCTLGYHLLQREKRLNIVYPIRSCDLFRHFRDDVYMAGRLVQWTLERLQLRDDRWLDVRAGELVMNIGSLHVFEPEMKTLRRQAGILDEEDFTGVAV